MADPAAVAAGDREEERAEATEDGGMRRECRVYVGRYAAAETGKKWRRQWEVGSRVEEEVVGDADSRIWRRQRLGGSSWDGSCQRRGQRTIGGWWRRGVCGFGLKCEDCIRWGGARGIRRFGWRSNVQNKTD